MTPRQHCRSLKLIYPERIETWLGNLETESGRNSALMSDRPSCRIFVLRQRHVWDSDAIWRSIRVVLLGLVYGVPWSAVEDPSVADKTESKSFKLQMKPGSSYKDCFSNTLICCNPLFVSTVVVSHGWYFHWCEVKSVTTVLWKIILAGYQARLSPDSS